MVPDDTQDPTRTPCPSCASVGRAHARTVVDMVSTSTLTVHADLILGPGPRPWTEQWAILQHAYRDLVAFFTTPDPTAEQWKVHRTVNEFMTACFHLKDYLKSDPQLPQIVRGAVEQYVKASPALSLARDVANTTKHRSRKPHERYARVGEIGTGPGAVVHWEAPDGSTGKEEVVALAKAAVQDWEAFLQQHGLSA